MTSVNTAESSLNSPHARSRTSPLASQNNTSKVVTPKLEAFKPNSDPLQKWAAAQSITPAPDTLPDENFQEDLAADNTSSEPPVDSASANALDAQNSLAPQLDEQVSSMTAAAGVSGTTWGVLVGGLGLAAKGDSGGAGGVPTPPAPKLTIDKIASDDVIGPTEKNSTVIQGATEAGSSVQVKMGDRLRTATVTGTTWRYLITAEDIAAMGQGDAWITVIASLSDGRTVSFSRPLKVFAFDGIVDIGITSAQGIQNETLNAKDVVLITVKMSDAFNVIGTPQLSLDIDGTPVVANYVSGSGTSSLVFSYAIVDGQNDPNGISIQAGALMLNGGSLLNANGKPPAALSYGTVGSNDQFLVDTSPPTLANLSYKVAENNTAVTTLRGADVSTITYSLAGANGDDTGLFLLSEGGVLTLKVGANFESMGNGSTDHTYKLGVNMTDLAGNVSYQALIVEVTNVYEAPVITSAARVGFAENGSGIAYQAQAVDENPSAVLTYSISGTDAALFNVNANTGAVTFKMAPNFESPVDAGADNVYNFALKVSNATLSTTQEVEIGVTNVSDLNFNLNLKSTLSAQARLGFQQAAAFWSSLFSDDVMVNLNLDYTADGFEQNPNAIGGTMSDYVINSYASVRNALAIDAKSSMDALAVASLNTAPAFDMLLNRTSNHPLGPSSSLAYKDNDGDENNRYIYLTRANAKSLGLLAQDLTVPDATIVFNSAFSFDFDRSDGIDSGKTDFVGAAIHEIGHVLGFTSGVDFLDLLPGFNDNQYTLVTPLDLFRYSEASTKLLAIDWTASATDKYFSLNNGLTKIASFSTGTYYGDGRQNSHWKDDLGLGGLDPSLKNGELLQYTSLDQLAFDVIGWDLTSAGNHLSAPQITSLNSVKFAEKGTNTVYTVVATDSDPWDQLSFALSGTDATLFTIDTHTGVVKFKTPPKYDAPADSNADNNYQISVTANDGVFTSAAQRVNIQVMQDSQNTNAFMASANSTYDLSGTYHVL